MNKENSIEEIKKRVYDYYLLKHPEEVENIKEDSKYNYILYILIIIIILI